MSKLKHILLAFFIFSTFACLCSCFAKEPGLKAFPAMEEKGFIPATVIRYSLDGCSWMLALKDGKKLQPENLKADFQKDKLEVWIRYQLKKGGMSICMAGEIVTITEIELR